MLILVRLPFTLGRIPEHMVGIPAKVWAAPFMMDQTFQC